MSATEACRPIGPFTASWWMFQRRAVLSSRVATLAYVERRSLGAAVSVDWCHPRGDGVRGGQFGFGRAFSKWWNIEGYLSVANLNGFPGQDQTGFGADLQLVLNRSGRITPYFFVGSGYLLLDPDGADESDGLMLSGGKEFFNQGRNTQLDADFYFGSPATMAMAGGRFFGFVIGGALPVTVAAGWLATAWDQNSGLHDVTPVSAELEVVALGWLVDRPSVTSVILGARTVYQLNENLKAASVKLSADEVATLDAQLSAAEATLAPLAAEARPASSGIKKPHAPE